MPPRTRKKTAKTKQRRNTETVDPAVVPLLIGWFLKHARDLPWRVSDPNTALRDPYRVLVSEVMLQQTQVSRVEPKFHEFLKRFPTIRDLATAAETDVLAAWTGLGYYRRARMLHAAAKKVAADFSGAIPRTTEQLRMLPGIGAYTAGAIASLAHGEPAPLVDTNVSRVLLRLAGKPLKTSDPAAQAWCWEKAEALVHQAHKIGANDRRATPINAPGAFNESLMELGATVCTLSTPACNQCPVARCCNAFKAGVQHQIPLAPDPKKRSSVVHAVLVIRDECQRILVEQRNTAQHKNALWEDLWQAPTHECDSAPKSATALAQLLNIRCAATSIPRKSFDFVFKTTLRDVRFVVWDVTLKGAIPMAMPPRQWKSVAELETIALSSPMRRILLAQKR